MHVIQKRTEFDRLMFAAKDSMPTAAEKSFLLTMEDIYRDCEFRNGSGNPVADVHAALGRLGGCRAGSEIAAVYEFVLDKAISAAAGMEEAA